jgi:hypothetical protein
MLYGKGENVPKKKQPGMGGLCPYWLEVRPIYPHGAGWINGQESALLNHPAAGSIADAVEFYQRVGEGD